MKPRDETMHRPRDWRRHWLSTLRERRRQRSGSDCKRNGWRIWPRGAMEMRFALGCRRATRVIAHQFLVPREGERRDPQASGAGAIFAAPT